VGIDDAHGYRAGTEMERKEVKRIVFAKTTKLAPHGCFGIGCLDRGITAEAAMELHFP
jgi:hypothetical protein